MTNPSSRPTKGLVRFAVTFLLSYFSPFTEIDCFFPTPFRGVSPHRHPRSHGSNTHTPELGLPSYARSFSHNVALTFEAFPVLFLSNPLYFPLLLCTDFATSSYAPSALLPKKGHPTFFSFIQRRPAAGVFIPFFSPVPLPPFSSLILGNLYFRTLAS